MNTSTKKTISTLLLLALIVLVLYGVVHKLVDNKTKSLQSELDTRTDSQLEKLSAIADATKQNSADATVAQVIKDCTAEKRKDFDTLLDKLSSTISKPELSKLTGLFYECGNFYAQQRSLMALVLNREVAILEDTVNLSGVLVTPPKKLQSALKTWQDIAVAETKISSFFTQLVELQGSIIASLSSGKTANSLEVTSALSDVAKVRGQMVVLSKQVEDYRATLLSI